MTVKITEWSTFLNMAHEFQHDGTFMKILGHLDMF